MGTNVKMRDLAEEAIEIIREVLINNELVNGDLIACVRRNESGDTIIIRDLLNCEVQYSLSEVSCVFTDSIDCMGHINKSVYKTVLASKNCEDYEKYKKSFMQCLLRLREIETSV